MGLIRTFSFYKKQKVYIAYCTSQNVQNNGIDKWCVGYSRSERNLLAGGLYGGGILSFNLIFVEMVFIPKKHEQNGKEQVVNLSCSP